MTIINENFQARSSRVGEEFHRACVFTLKAAGWTVIDEKTKPDPEYPALDIVAEDSDGTLWWIECKGSYDNYPGLERSDTVKKALCDVYDTYPLRVEWSQDGERPIPYGIMTSHFPKNNPRKQVERAMTRGVLDMVWEVPSGEVWR